MFSLWTAKRKRRFFFFFFLQVISCSLGIEQLRRKRQKITSVIWCLLGRASDSILVLHRYINWITGESHRVQLGWARGFRMMHIYDWESTRSVWTSSLRRHWIRFYFSLMFASAKRVLKSNVRRCAIWWELGTNQSWTKVERFALGRNAICGSGPAIVTWPAQFATNFQEAHE